VLPKSEERFKEARIDQNQSENNCIFETDIVGNLVKNRRISCWNFNVDSLELVPVFPEKNKLDVENEEDEDINTDNSEEGKKKNEKVMHCNSVLKQMLAFAKGDVVI
jgi:hypothetical protein